MKLGTKNVTGLKLGTVNISRAYLGSTLVWEAGGDPGGFSPADLAGLQLWLDASDASTITESSGSISEWRDKSGNANHAAQATGTAQPAIAEASLNGLNTVDLGATSTAFMTLAAAVDLGQSASSGTSTVYFVAETSGNPNDSVLASGANNNWYVGLGSDQVMYRTSGNFDTHSIASASGYRLISATRDGASVSVWAEGVASANNPRSKSGSITIQRLGRRLSATKSYFGKVAEVIIYNSAHDDSTRQQVEAYLLEKWGLGA